MGTAGCHLPCFVPEDTTKWQVLFYHDVSLHINNVYASPKKKAESRRTCCLQSGLQRISNRLTWLLATLMVLHGAASRAAVLDSSAVLKKRSSIRTCHCHPASHLCGGQEVYQVNGLMYVDYLDRRGSEADRQIRNHGAVTIPYSTLGLRLRS